MQPCGNIFNKQFQYKSQNSYSNSTRIFLRGIHERSKFGKHQLTKRSSVHVLYNWISSVVSRYDCPIGSTVLSSSQKIRINLQDVPILYRPDTCMQCSNTGWMHVALSVSPSGWPVVSPRPQAAASIRVCACTNVRSQTTGAYTLVRLDEPETMRSGLRQPQPSIRRTAASVYAVCTRTCAFQRGKKRKKKKENNVERVRSDCK